MREQSAWCLANIAGDGAEMRDIVLRSGALQPLLKNIQQPANLSLLRNTVWAVSNFCRGKPQPPFGTMAAALPILGDVLNQEDKEVLMDACWATSYLSDGSKEQIDAINEARIIWRLVQLLSHKCPSVVTPALRTIGNIVSGDDNQTQTAIDAGCLHAVPPLLEHMKKGIRKEACWMLSNIAAGNQNQITILLQCQEVIDAVLTRLIYDDWDVRKEAAWVIFNLATGGTHEQVFALIRNHRCIEPLCSLLAVSDSKILHVALDTLEALLKCDYRSSGLLQVSASIDAVDGLEKIEALQEHQDEAVYGKAVRLIETHFGDEAKHPTESLADSSFHLGSYS